MSTLSSCQGCSKQTASLLSTNNADHLKVGETMVRLFGTWIHYDRKKWVNIVAYFLLSVSIIIIAIQTYNKIDTDWTNFKWYFVCLTCICRILWFRYKYKPLWNDKKLTNFFEQIEIQRYYKIQLLIFLAFSIVAIANSIYDITLQPLDGFIYVSEICQFWCYNMPTWLTVGIFQWYFKIYQYHLQCIHTDFKDFSEDFNEKKLDEITVNYLEMAKKFIDDTQNNLKYIFEILLFIIVIATLWDNIAREITFQHIFYSVSYIGLMLYWFYPAKCVNDTHKKFSQCVLDTIEEIRCNDNIREKSEEYCLLTKMNILNNYCSTSYRYECKIGGIRVTKFNLFRIIVTFICSKVISWLYKESIN